MFFYMYAQRNYSAGKICAKLPRYEKCQCEQQFDNSCGSASLATILTYFYGAPISEKQVMDLIGKDAKMASFADLARVATQKVFGACGLAMNFFHAY